MKLHEHCIIWLTFSLSPINLGKCTLWWKEFYTSLLTGNVFCPLSLHSTQGSRLALLPTFSVLSSFTLSSPLFTFTTGSFTLYLPFYSLSPPLPHLCSHSASDSIYPGNVSDYFSLWYRVSRMSTWFSTTSWISSHPTIFSFL